MNDHPAFFAIMFCPDRFHRVFAGAFAIAGIFFVNMEAVEAFSAVVTTTSGLGRVFVATVLADERSVDDDKLFHRLNIARFGLVWRPNLW